MRKTITNGLAPEGRTTMTKVVARTLNESVGRSRCCWQADIIKTVGRSVGRRRIDDVSVALEGVAKGERGTGFRQTPLTNTAITTTTTNG